MKRIFAGFSQVVFGVLWLIGLAGAGALLLRIGGGLVAPRYAPGYALARLGADFGLNIYIFLLCFGLLPGARQPRVGAEFNAWSAARVIAGFGVMMVGGGISIYNLLSVQRLVLLLRHSGAVADAHSPSMMIIGVLAGEIVAALWLWWFIRGLGPGRLADGSPSGIGWRAATRDGYLAAALAAVVIIFAVSVLYHFDPPDLQALKNLPDAQMFEHPGALLVPLLILFIVFGPVVEEVVFRGVAFAALASRFSPRIAGVVTTLLFVAMHAPEKIHYPAGFVDVGAMAAAACWLRVRFGSIRPGILLHILYNGGLMLAAGAM